MNRNEKGFSALHILLLLLVVSFVSFAGLYVYNNQSDSEESQDNNAQLTAPNDSSAESANETAKPEEEIAKKTVSTDDWKTLSIEVASIKYPTTLAPHGTCSDGQGLLGIIYNSDITDYDCSGASQALGYASIVFGAGEKSVVGTIFGNTTDSTEVTIAGGLTATKYVFTNTEKDQLYRYVVYENKQGDKYSYGIYKTGVGFSDEDVFLSGFTAVIENGWTIK